VGVSELARQSELPKSTVHRLVAALDRAGLLVRVGHDYLVGSRVLDLVRLAHRPAGFYPRLLPHLAEFYAHTRGCVGLAVLQGNDVLGLGRISNGAAEGVEPQVGARKPAHQTTSGKVLLAYDADAANRYLEKCDLNGSRDSTGRSMSPMSFRSELRRIRSAGAAIDRTGPNAGVLSLAAPMLDVTGRALAAVTFAGKVPPSREVATMEALQRAARAASLAVLDQTPQPTLAAPS
jgi:IclR family transcriptional regulator, KDG regulon repressor